MVTAKYGIHGYSSTVISLVSMVVVMCVIFSCFLGYGGGVMLLVPFWL